LQTLAWGENATAMSTVRKVPPRMAAVWEWYGEVPVDGRSHLGTKPSEANRPLILFCLIFIVWKMVDAEV